MFLFTDLIAITAKAPIPYGSNGFLITVIRNQTDSIKPTITVTPDVESRTSGDGETINITVTGLLEGITYTFVIQALDANRCFEPVGAPVTGIYQLSVSRGKSGQ